MPGDALGPYGWSDRILALFNEIARPGLEPARVVRVERSVVVAVLPDGAERLVRAPPAAGAGQLDPARLASYGKLQREVAAEERRSDPLARRAHVNPWKAVFQEARERGRRTSR